MNDQLNALLDSAERLRGIAERLTPDQLRSPAYPSEWTVADVLSHLGSGAVIMQRRLDDALAGHDVPDDFAPSVWDAWNAKSPEAKAADSIAADRALLQRLSDLTEDERARFRTSMGPMTLDIQSFTGLRLNEHALHTWDIEVVLEPGATVGDSAARLIVDNLEIIARFGGRPTGAVRAMHIRTSEPTRDFTISMAPEALSFAPGQGAGQPDVDIPAEALVRLVYGRLDPAHTPAVNADPAVLDELRQAFPGL
jgi:uncharacterized protein (TIGR03083 family)